MSFPIYVLSKGRAWSATTCTALDHAQLPYTLVTTPEEADAYRAQYQGNVLPLQREGMHIGQVRNCILDEADLRGQSKIWMVDDDILSIFSVQKQEGYIWEFLAVAEQTMMERGAAVVGLSESEDRGNAVKMDRDCYHMLALDLEKIGRVRYDEQLYFFSDTDFLLQLLLDGKRTARLSTYGYQCAMVGATAGGLYETYQQHNRLTDALTLIARYGIDLVTLFPPPVGRPGWVQLHVAWHHAVAKGKKHAASARL